MPLPENDNITLNEENIHVKKTCTARRNRGFAVVACPYFNLSPACVHHARGADSRREGRDGRRSGMTLPDAAEVGREGRRDVIPCGKVGIAAAGGITS